MYFANLKSAKYNGLNCKYFKNEMRSHIINPFALKLDFIEKPGI